METIDTNTVMADNFSDLSSVLTANSEYTYMYLGTDFGMAHKSNVSSLGDKYVAKLIWQVNPVE